MKFFKTISLLSPIILVGCVKAHTVQSPTLGMERGAYECQEISDRIGELNAIQNMPTMGKNVASALFFWPAIFVNMSNQKKTEDSSNKEIALLKASYDEQSCTTPETQYTKDEIKDMLKNNTTKTSIKGKSI